MPSILPDYVYDIFISYRQNDNQDGWVTEFVESLNREIKSTFKEEINIYFDRNPHDGIAETHDVNDSLVKKLKCLIFIPVISKTYCDPNSFAWTNEFLAFNQLASNDEFGLKVDLPNGNTANRVLPIKIHEIDEEDKQLVENEIGFLRSIDFVYNSAGVNRPLRSKDDDVVRDASQTFYRDQINKVANSIQQIVKGLRGITQTHSEKPDSTTYIAKGDSPAKQVRKDKKLIIFGITIALLVASISYFLMNKGTGDFEEEIEKSIAVLAFDDQSPDGDQEWLGDGVADEILNVLAQVKGLKVSGKTSSFSFKGKDATIKEIGEALDVRTVLEGSVSKVGNRIRITAQLIDVESDKHLWSSRYDSESEDIFSIMDDVSQNIATALMGELSINEYKITRGNSVNEEAYEYYLKGVHLHWNNYIISRDEEDFLKSEQMFISAISIDSGYAEAYAGLADLYDTKVIRDTTFNRKRDSVINIGFRVNPNSAYLLMTKGFKFRQLSNLNLDSAFHFFKKAYDLDPNNVPIKNVILGELRSYGLYDEAIKLSSKVLESDPLNSFARGVLAGALHGNGRMSESREQYIRVLEFDKNSIIANIGMFHFAALHDRDTSEASRVHALLNGTEFNSTRHAMLLAIKGKREEALETFPAVYVYSILDMKAEMIQRLDSVSVQRAYSGAFTYLNMKNCSLYDIIRDDPKFVEISNGAKLIHEERVRRFGNLFLD